MEAKGELAALRQVYSDDNARVKAAQARIDELQRQVNVMGGFSSNGKSGSESKSLYPSAAELPNLGYSYSELERRVKVDEDLWDTLTRQYEAARVAEAKEVPTVHVLDAATIPEKKSAPFRALIMVVGTFLSFVFACVGVIAFETWKQMDPQNEAKQLVEDVLFATSRWVPFLHRAQKARA